MTKAKTYSVRDIFWTIQGEGINAGRAAMFVRFAGCNMWNGTAPGREHGQGACSQWCDTAFTNGTRYDASQLVITMNNIYGNMVSRQNGPRLCVISGGEPCLQIDEHLIATMQACGWEVAVETNGTIASPALQLANHVCVSPKLGGDLKLYIASELKVVLPGVGPGDGVGWTHEMLHELGGAGVWGRKYVQPQDMLLSPAVEDTVLHPSLFVPSLDEEFLGEKNDRDDEMRARHQSNVLFCTEWVRRFPDWRLSVQTHKMVGLL